MITDPLALLVPPPAQPLGARADRATSAELLGYTLPDSAWEVVERWGDGSWVSWLFMPSPHHASGRDELEGRLADARAIHADARLLAYDEGGELLVYALDGEEVWVSAGGEASATEMTFPELLVAWLTGASDLLPPVAELTSDEAIAPYFERGLDPARSSHLFEVQVRGAGSRDERWATFSAALGEHVPWSRLGEGEARQERVYVTDLELNLMFESGSLHVWCYDDRLEDVKARLATALSAASMVVTGVRAPRGWDPHIAVGGGG